MGITYGGIGQPMEIGCQKPTYNAKGEPKYFNYNTYGHMAKDCRKLKNKGCFNCGKEEHMAKNYRLSKKAKIRSVENVMTMNR